MRPLFHPSMEDVTVQGVLYALSDPIRMRIFVKLTEAECGQNCVQLAHLGELDLPKSTLSQHFKILREAGLIRSERKGVELQNLSRCAELKKRFGPMIMAIVQAYEREGKAAGR